MVAGKRSSIVDQLDVAMSRISSLADDAEKFDAGNNAAGTRLRVQLQGIIKGIKGTRVDILDTQKSRKKK